MLSASDSIASYKASNIAIWMLMAFQGGFLNMGGFMACHRFVSHVTGYGTSVAYELAKNNFNEAMLMAIVPAFFLLGACVSGFLVDVRLRLRKKPRYSLAFGLIFGILLVIILLGTQGYLGTFGKPLLGLEDYLLLLLLTFTCGVQNGVITTVSKAVVRTTHLSGMTTDLGIGIARYILSRKMGTNESEESRANLMRLGIILFFILGSFIGCLLFSKYQFGGFLLPLFTSGLLVGAMVYSAYMDH